MDSLIEYLNRRTSPVLEFRANRGKSFVEVTDKTSKFDMYELLKSIGYEHYKKLEEKFVTTLMSTVDMVMKLMKDGKSTGTKKFVCYGLLYQSSSIFVFNPAAVVGREHCTLRIDFSGGEDVCSFVNLINSSGIVSTVYDTRIEKGPALELVNTYLNS